MRSKAPSPLKARTSGGPARAPAPHEPAATAGGAPPLDSASSATPGRAAPRPAMKIEQVLAELEAAAAQLGIRVTYEAIGGELGSGGLCKVKGAWRAIIDKRATPSERVSVLAPALLRFAVDEVALSEPVR